MKVRHISDHVYINTLNQRGGAFPIYKGRRKMMMRGGNRLGFLINMGKKMLAPLGKHLLSKAKKKIVPIIAERGSQILSGGLTPKQAMKAVVKDSARAVLGTTREALERELTKGSKKRKQKGKGLVHIRGKTKYKY